MKDNNSIVDFLECRSCIKRNVCKYKDNIDILDIKDNVIEGRRIALKNNFPFVINIQCKEYIEQKNGIRYSFDF